MGVPVRYFPGACCLKSCLLRNARIYSDRRLLQAAVPVPRSASGHSSFGRRLSLRLLALSSSDVEVGSRLGSPISLQYGCRRWRRWGYSVGSRPCFLLRRPALSARLCDGYGRGWTLPDTNLAEREGFEPPIRLPVCRISSAVRSTTLPPLRGRIGRKQRRRSGAMYPRRRGETRAPPRRAASD
jgi:hypothetical protein